MKMWSSLQGRFCLPEESWSFRIFFTIMWCGEDSISTRKDQTKNIQDLFQTLKELDQLSDQQEGELRRWMKDALLDSYLNMVYSARMYQKQYRGLVDKRFLEGKAVTGRNRFRVLLCRLHIRLYCAVNDGYKWMRQAILIRKG